MERCLLKRGRRGGLAGLTRDASRAYWQRALREHADAIPVVGPKVYYVVSRVRPARLRLFQRASAWYLRTYYGPNDGAVARGDQSLPGLGTSLETLDAGHADLTRRFPATRAGRHVRKALIQSILMAVGRSGTVAPLRGTDHVTPGTEPRRKAEDCPTVPIRRRRPRYVPEPGRRRPPPGR